MEDVRDLAALTRRAADRWGTRAALCFDETGEVYSFDDIERLTNKAANALTALGIQTGDRVAIMLANRPDWPLTWLGIVKAGAVMVPVNRYYKSADAGFLFSHAGVAAIVTSDALAPIVRAAISEAGMDPAPLILSVDGDADGNAGGDVDGAGRNFRAAVQAAPETPRGREIGESSVANIQYTSGTTGEPKGCMLPNGWFTGFARRVQGTDFAMREGDIVLTAQPYYYVDPQWILATTLQAGAELVVLDRFHPSSFWDKLRQYGVTWFYCLGVMPKMLLNQPEDARDREHAVRLVVCSAIPPADHARIEARWGAPWYEAYGLTETGLDIAVTAEEHDALVGSGCIGRPMPEREVRIVDGEGLDVPDGGAGELIQRGPGMMEGYYRNPEATAAAIRDGWFHTGDLARRDENGLIYFTGRKKDMIRRAGENISAAEVEGVIMQHPAVELAACLAVPDDLRGEEIKAYVVLREAGALEPADLADWVADRLAYFKVPRYWTWRESLPRTPSERVIKSELAGQGEDFSVGAWDRSDGVWR